MRIAPVFLSILGLAIFSAAQDQQPTPDEQKAIAAIEKGMGTAGVDAALHKDARVAAKFETVTDATLLALARYPRVGAIQAFDATKCTAKGFNALKKLRHLRVLELNQSGVSDKELAEIGSCKELRKLVIPESSITDMGLVSIAKLTRLEYLDLSANEKISDRGMLQVKKLERLEFLFLNRTSISDRGLFELKPLEGLRSLNVALTKVTPDAAMKFADEMPNLRVVRR